jgi:hypothetical protein
MHMRRAPQLGFFLVALIALLAVGPVGLAQEIGDAQDVVGQLTDAADQVSGGGGPSLGQTSAPAAVPSQPSEDADTGAHETSDPAGPDHASGSVVDIDIAGDDAVDVGSTNAQIEDDGRASGDVTVLAIGGNEIVGAHSDSEAGPGSDTVAPFDALCEGSSGAICVGLLYADTTSTQEGGNSSAESDAALAFACVGGDDPDSDPACDAPIAAGLATSSSEVIQGEDGDTTATQETTLADVCLGGDDAETGACAGVGAELVRSESQSQATSSSQEGSYEGSSCTADVQVGGQGSCLIEDPQALEIPPGCPAGESVACLYLNQGEAFVFTGGAGGRQEAIHVSALPGAVDASDLANAHLATAETLATATGPDVAAGGTQPDAPEPPVVAAGGAGPGAELAFTGAEGLGLVAAILALAGLGALMLALDRRRAGRAA